MGGPSDNDSRSARVFYASPPQPAYIMSPVVGPSSAQAVNPAKSAVLSELGFRAGGFAGLDANGVLCWALPTSFNYQSYAYLRRMQSVSTIGASTTLQTLNLNRGNGNATDVRRYVRLGVPVVHADESVNGRPRREVTRSLLDGRILPNANAMVGPHMESCHPSRTSTATRVGTQIGMG